MKTFKYHKPSSLAEAANLPAFGDVFRAKGMESAPARNFSLKALDNYNAPTAL